MKLFYSQNIDHTTLTEIRILKKRTFSNKRDNFTHTMGMKIFFIVAQVVFHVEV